MKTGLTLLLGPANSGKLGRVLEWWQRSAASAGGGGHSHGARCPGADRRDGPPRRRARAAVARGDVRRSCAAAVWAGAALCHRARARTGRLQGARRDADRRRCGRPPACRASCLPCVPCCSNWARAVAPDDVDRILARWAASDPPAAAIVERSPAAGRGLSAMCGQLGLGDRPAAVREATRGIAEWAGAFDRGRSRSTVSRRSRRASARWSKSWRRGSRCSCRSPTTTRATSISARRARSSGGALGLEVRRGFAARRGLQLARPSSTSSGTS